MKDFRSRSAIYAALCEIEERAYAKLETLQLTEEQRIAVEEIYEAQSAADAEYAAESYLRGIADCLRFTKYICTK